MASDRFARFLPLAGVLAGLLLAGGLALTWSIPNSETSFDETFSWWQDNRGQHQISGLLLAPLVALMLIFFGAGLQRSLRSNRDSGHGSVAFGGAILAATGFALIGELEGAAANAAHEGHREAVYALSQLHSYDWLAFNAAWAAVLLATGLGSRRNGMLPSWLAWATIVLGVTQLTPIGFLGSLFIPPWLIVVGIWLFRTKTTSAEDVPGLGDNVAVAKPQVQRYRSGFLRDHYAVTVQALRDVPPADLVVDTGATAIGDAAGTVADSALLRQAFRPLSS